MTHVFPSGVRVIQIIVVCERNRSRLNHTTWGTIVKPVAGLNVVLPGAWLGAATSHHAERGRTQALKEIVGRAVLLNDHDDVLEFLKWSNRRQRLRLGPRSLWGLPIPSVWAPGPGLLCH